MICILTKIKYIHVCLKGKYLFTKPNIMDAIYDWLCIASLAFMILVIGLIFHFRKEYKIQKSAKKTYNK